MDDHVELLVTVVLAAESEDQARSACRDMVWQVEGRIVESTDCSSEEPGCWSVTLRVPTDERATHNVAAPLARAVRNFVRSLGPEFVMPTVACEPPTAWTVLDDPVAVDTLAEGAERLLVEAWFGGDPYPVTDRGVTPIETTAADREPIGTPTEWPSESETEPVGPELHETVPSRPVVADESATPVFVPDRTSPSEPSVDEVESTVNTPVPTSPPTDQRQRSEPVGWTPPPTTGPQENPVRGRQSGADRTPEGGCRLTLRVDVATSRASGAEWQARALASRISRTATLAGVTEHDGVTSVVIDLGTARTPAPQTVLTAVSALDRPGWSALRWEGDSAITTWTAHPRPTSGITELELSSSPDVRRRRG
jgi:hypothetical protein